MKKFDLSIFSIAILVLAAVLLGVGNAPAGAANGEVALVNGKAITQDQLYQELKNRYGEKELDRLVKNLLVEQEAAKVNVSVSQEELDKKFDEYVHLLETKLKKKLEDYLKENNITEEELKGKLKQKLLTDKLAEKEIQITDDEIKTLYEKRKDLFSKNGETYEQAKDKVKEAVLVKKMTKWLNTLKKNAQIVITDAKLAASQAEE